MSMEAAGSYFVSQILYQLPLIIACLVGVVLAIVFWSRSPGASLMTLIGCLVLLLAIFVVSGVQSYLVSARIQQGWTLVKYGAVTAVVSAVSALIRGAAFGCVIGAVFVGRRRSAA
jgi:hypothetical protein